jgi:hypothetical protein
MHFRALVLAILLVAVAPAANAQDMQDAITEEVIEKLLAGIAVEKPELDKVAGELAELDQKIDVCRACLRERLEAAAAPGRDLGGLSGRVAVRAKCGASNDEGMVEDRQKLLENPERVGARAAGMRVQEYVRMKELATMYLDGSRNFPPASLTALGARATDLSNALGIPIAEVTAGGGGGGGRSGGGGGLGGALAMRMFTPDMTWAYVGYLWGIMYMSGATMFETPYQSGQWTSWEITDASEPEQKLVLERALIRTEADGSQWWRIKTVTVTPEASDTITLESQFKPMDDQGLMMQVVRMRGKMPGDTEGKELIVPQQFSMLGASMMFPFKPTPESVAGATVGTESIRGFSSRHVKFGAGQGSMEWWLADDAPGGVVRVQFTGQSDDEKWIMDMTGSGTGATSELGI